MRGKKRNHQKFYLVEYTETDVVDDYGDKTGEKLLAYTLKQVFSGSISVYQNTPEQKNAGIVGDYERILTIFDRVELHEGDELFIDIEPIIEDNVISNVPDYVVKKPIMTKTGLIDRYGVSKKV